MVATRNTFRSDTPGPISGDDFLDQVSDNTKVLFDMSTIGLSAVGGTADDVTATVVPSLDGDGITTGMKFTIQWAATNTGPMTLSVNGETPRPVLNHEGLAIPPGAVTSSVYSLLLATGTNYRILSPLLAGSSGANARFYEVFTTNGTWTKPSGLDDDTMVTVKVIGGGGGGSSSSLSGGGGGGAAIGRFRIADLPATVAVTIGAGGAVGAIGGNTTFGTLLTGYGGGSNSSGTSGAGGGGEISAGALNSATPGAIGGGAGGENSAGEHARTIYGGGGGANATGQPSNGGSAVHGGGGGSSNVNGSVGGISLFAGNGGSWGSVAGSAPGGGGAATGAGARGEVRVWI